MGSISLPTLALITAAGTAVSVGVEAYGQHEAGVAEANVDKQKARAAAIDEQQKQINMRQNMLKALAAQNAGALGAVGTGAGTGFGANARRQINQAQNDLMVSKANASAQESLFDTAASAATAAGNISAVGDVARAAPSVVQGINTYING